jgi:putative ABC transport system permease protein
MSHISRLSRSLFGYAVERFWWDVRYAARQYRRAPGFAAVAVLTLALGIGVMTAILSMVEGVLLRPLPYRAPQQLVVIWQTDALHHESGAYFNSYREFEVFQQESRSFDRLAALTWATESQSTLWKGQPIDVLALPVSLDFFPLLGESAAMGRTFAQSDTGSGCMLVLADHFWRAKLGAPHDILGQRIHLNESTCEIAGVMPAKFSFYPTAADAWTLITPGSAFETKPWRNLTGVFGRLKPGVSRSQAEAELTTIQSHIVQEAPPDLQMMRTLRPDVLDLQSNFTWLTGRNLRKGLWMLLAASGFLLAIAAVNVGGLMLGRSIMRTREVAVRSALGSSRCNLLIQALAECLLLAACGTVSGVALAYGLLAWFRSLNPVELPPGATVAIDGRVLLVTAASGIASCIVFAVLPAWHNAYLNVNEMLKSTGVNGSRAASRSHASQSLVVIQIALSMVLLLAAGTVSVSLWNLTSTALGYRSDHLFTATLRLPETRYSTVEARARVAQQIVEKVSTVHGVESAAVGSDYVPRGLNPLSVEGASTPATPSADVSVQVINASALGTLQIPQLRGRNFDERDQANTQPVAIVNEALVREYFPRTDPLGHAIKLSRVDDPSTSWLTIIGVVGDVKTTTVFQEMGYVEPPAVYRPMTQSAPATLMVMASFTNAPSLLRDIQRQLAGTDPSLVLSEVDALHFRRTAELSQPRFRAALFGGFAALALVLALVGLYGTLSQAIARRRREISIRMALGADRKRILRSVLGEACSMTIAGALLGGVCGALCIRLAQGLFYGLHAGAAWEFAAAVAALLLSTIAAALRPAYRAASTDPIRALRED